MKTDQDSLAARFLLGKLGAEETLKLEKDYFSNNRRFEEILAAENDLIDAYAMDKLSAEDRNRFENRLLLNPHQRRRVQFAQTLFKYASSQPLAADEVNSSAVKTLWLAALSRLFSNKPLLSFSFSLAALTVFAGAIWFVLNKASSEPTGNFAASQAPQIWLPPPLEITNEAVNPNKNAKTNSNDAPAPQKSVQTHPFPKQEKPQKNKTSVIYSLILSPGLTRDDGGASRTFTIPARTDSVKMRLKFEQGGFSAYHAVLETIEGSQIWSSNKLRADKDARSVTISIPSKFLKKSDYILTLKGITKDGISETVENYAFTVNP